MDNNQEQYICKTDGFKKRGFPQRNIETNKMVRVNHGDIVSSDSKGYLLKDGICLCHKESIVGKYHFHKLSKKRGYANSKNVLDR